MNGSAAWVAYLILAAFFGGVTLGVVAMVAIAVKRPAFPGTTPDPTTTRTGRGRPVQTSAAGRAALGEGKLSCAPGGGRGAG